MEAALAWSFSRDKTRDFLTACGEVGGKTCTSWRQGAFENTISVVHTSVSVTEQSWDAPWHISV